MQTRVNYGDLGSRLYVERYQLLTDAELQEERLKAALLANAKQLKQCKLSAANFMTLMYTTLTN